MRMSDFVWVLKNPASSDYVVSANDRHETIWSVDASDALQFPNKRLAFEYRDIMYPYCKVMRRNENYSNDGPFEISGNRIVERELGLGLYE